MGGICRKYLWRTGLQTNDDLTMFCFFTFYTYEHIYLYQDLGGWPIMTSCFQFIQRFPITTSSTTAATTTALKSLVKTWVVFVLVWFFLSTFFFLFFFFYQRGKVSFINCILFTISSHSFTSLRQIILMGTFKTLDFIAEGLMKAKINQY